LVLAGLAVLAGAGPARANMAAVQLHPAKFAPPIAVRAAGVKVESERLRFECEARAGAPSCRFEAVYTVRNPGDAAETVVGAFYGARAKVVAISAGEARVDRALSAEEGAALDEALEAAAGDQIRRQHSPLSVKDEAAGRFGFELALGPGERASLAARGTLEPGERWVPKGYGSDAVEARHLLLGKSGRERSWDLEYLVAPIWTWTGDPTIDVELVVRGPYRVSLGEGWTRQERDGATRATRRWSAHEAPAALQVLLSQDAPLLGNGGVLLGFGGTFGEGRPTTLRARLGYEANVLGWLLVSAAAETDFEKRAQLVPAVEAASPGLWVIPSVGIGLGMPVQVSPGPRVAGRLQASLMFYPVGVFAAVDYYPRAGPSADFLEGTVMLQASF
jgi:hypothetical protein